MIENQGNYHIGSMFVALNQNLIDLNDQDVALERRPWRRYSVHKQPNALTVKEVDKKNALIKRVEEMGQVILALQFKHTPEDLAFSV
jgi:hypothetical protein